MSIQNDTQNSVPSNTSRRTRENTLAPDNAAAPGNAVIAENEAPIGSLTIVYMGPIAPHWEIHLDKGDQNQLEDFKSRALARLLLMPPHDPQFRRNKERIVRDAERQNIILNWDLGFDEAELEDRTQN